MFTNLDHLRAGAVSHTLFPPTDLWGAIQRLGFVQADPIRAPARAQDLILRHRVVGYRVGALEQEYPGLPLEEGLLHVYGFLPRSDWDVLRPPHPPPPEGLVKQVLEEVRQTPAPVQARDLDEPLGRATVRSGWGASTRATRRALEQLHRQGRVRVAERKGGARRYQEAHPHPGGSSPEERFRQLVLLLARLLAPVLHRTLQAQAARLRRRVPAITDHRAVLAGMVEDGTLQAIKVAGLDLLWPADCTLPEPSPPRVRFLAPFDPLVWDRERFEALWGWPYRFEAYTPPAQRIRGYYAMPLLCGNRVIGWANLSQAGGELQTELGFVEGGPPDDPEFADLLQEERAGMERFLQM